MKRKYYCQAMKYYDQQYALCDEVASFENLTQISEEIVIAVKGYPYPLMVNRLAGELGLEAAHEREEYTWNNDEGWVSVTPFGNFVD